MDSSAPLPAPDAILQHAQFVRSLARHLLAGDEHEADDLAQEALLRYVQSPPRDRLDPRAWFARVLRNLAHNRRRGEANRSLREERAARSEIAAPDECAHEAMLRSVVEAVLALDEPYRSTIVARYYRGHEPSRIARETDTALATVKSRLSRAHQKLREHLDRAHGSRDAWGMTLGSLVGGAGQATVATTTSTAAVIGFVTLALVVGALSFATWRSNRADADEKRAELARTALEAELASPAREGLPPLAGAGRKVAKAAIPEGTFAIEGSLLNAAYPPLSLPGGAASGVKLEVRVATEPRGRGKILSHCEIVSDAAGHFSAELPLPACDCLISIAARADEHWRAVSFEEAVASGARSRPGIELVRVAHGILEGKVVDVSGAPVPGLAVRLFSGQTGQQRDLTSDEQGELRSDLPGSVSSVLVQDPAWSVLSFEHASPLPAGGEIGLKVIVTPGARIELRAIDAHGAGLADVQVQIDLDPAEQPADTEHSTGAQTQFTHTDAEGRAEICGLWAGRKLRISLAWRGLQKQRSSGLRGNELLFDAAELAGAPIILRSGEVRELVARWTGLLRIEGEVVHPDLSPAADVAVSFYDLGRRDGGNQSIASTRTDAQGTIAFELRSRELLGPLAVLGCESAQAPARKAGGLGYSGDESALQALAMVTLDPGQAVEGMLSVHLALAPPLSIRGRVLEADGSPIADAENVVRLECAKAGESALSIGQGPLSPVLTWSTGGQFELRGLPAGSYDLYAARVEWPTFYSWSTTASCTRSVPAGTNGVELALEARAEARIKVRVGGAVPRSALALRAKLSAEASESSVPAAPRTIVVESAASWPVHATLRFAGISEGVDERGRWAYGFDSFEPAVEFELPAVDPGIYVIGVQLFAADGRMTWFPVASAPLRFEAGEYEIEFHALATGILEGQVQGDAHEERIGVQLLDSGGSIVPLPRADGRGRMELAREVDARGHFRIDPAPCGRFRLRLGRLDELAQGRCRAEVAVEIGGESSAPIELRWR